MSNHGGAFSSYPGEVSDYYSADAVLFSISYGSEQSLIGYVSLHGASLLMVDPSFFVHHVSYGQDSSSSVFHVDVSYYLGELGEFVC